MRPLQRTAALLACAAALAGAGCGSEDEGDPIPRDVVSGISQELTSVQNRVSFAQENPDARGEGACNDLEDDSFATLERLLGRVPDGVSQDVRDALTQSVDKLRELTRSVCEDVRKEADETDTTPTEPVPTEPVPTTTPPTIPPETTPTEPETTPQEKPRQPRQNQGEGNGNGGGDEGTGGANPPGGD